MSTDVSEFRAASIMALMMVAAGTAETSVDIQLRTLQYIPEDSEIHTRRQENLKSHNKFLALKRDKSHSHAAQIEKDGNHRSDWAGGWGAEMLYPCVSRYTTCYISETTEWF
jgi:hypothetical protein